MIIELGTVNFTPEVLSSAIGLFLMLVFAYFPGVRLWFAALKSEVKSWIMIGLLLLAEVVIVLLAHFGYIVPAEPITLARIVTVAIALLVSNQPTYTLLPEAADVKTARLARDAKVALDLVEDTSVKHGIA